jgi:nucleoside-diphosphate-sugar epimerase
MERSILITGANGFLGSRLLADVLATAGRVVCLGHRAPSAHARDVEFVAGDLLDHAACRKAVKGCDTVLHLAAATGKHPPAEYFRVNRDGTAILLQQSEESGVERFLYVSTIAARFENRSHYYYADSKLQAEGLVHKSGLKWAIVRPTMIFGPGSPVQDGLRRLAALPLLPVFGNGRTPVQPVFVGDVVKVIAGILETDAFGGRTIEIGGPEVLSIEDLLLRMRRVAGVRNNRVIHLPVNAIAACLGAIEPVLRPLLPITAGQLASFINRGDAAPDAFVARWQPSMCGVDEMLRLR